MAAANGISIDDIVENRQWVLNPQAYTKLEESPYKAHKELEYLTESPNYAL